jgi:hypothetical protein
MGSALDAGLSLRPSLVFFAKARARRSCRRSLFLAADELLEMSVDAAEGRCQPCSVVVNDEYLLPRRSSCGALLEVVDLADGCSSSASMVSSLDSTERTACCKKPPHPDGGFVDLRGDVMAAVILSRHRKGRVSRCGVHVDSDVKVMPSPQTFKQANNFPKIVGNHTIGLNFLLSCFSRNRPRAKHETSADASE